jgi:hypothetical protein
MNTMTVHFGSPFTPEVDAVCQPDPDTLLSGGMAFLPGLQARAEANPVPTPDLATETNRTGDVLKNAGCGV